MVALGPDFALRRGNEDEIARENSQFNCNTQSQVATPINIRYNGWEHVEDWEN